MVTSKRFFLLAALPHLLAAQSTVTLSSTPSPSRFGAPVVLTATVTIAAATYPAAPTGKITFYDGVTILGTAPAVAKSFNSSSASLSTILLPAGNRKLKAYYSGDATNSPAASNILTQTVNALAVSNFAAVGSGRPGYDQPFVADFNGDGIADIIFGDFLGDVYLGDGKGGFRPTLQLPQNRDGLVVLAVGDFNGDGKPDVAFVDHPNDFQFKVLLGNGDGTFQAPLTIPILSPAGPVVVADFNGDGKPDLAGNFGLLLGNGDGTFERVPNGLITGNATTSIVADDFNGDGIPDLVITDGTNSYLSLLLGNGDGTFQRPVQLPIPTNALSLKLVSGDFNGDGRPDLAAALPTYGASADKLYIYLGRGDGTFQALATYPLPSYGGNTIVPGDFNGDGIIDLAFNGPILAGNGDGTFRLLFDLPVGGPFHGLTADFNGDGRPDLVINDGNVYLGTTTVITASGGTPQSTIGNTPFAAPLEVTVTDGGVALSGATVTFQAPSFGAGALLSSGTAVTDASGKARVTAAANAALGSYTVTAQYQSRVVAFSLTNVSGAPARIAATDTAPQTTATDTPFGKPLAVAVSDAGGNPLSGVTVTFQAPASGASAVLSSASAVTNAAGTASITATANHTPGSYTVTASVGSLSVGFPLTNQSGASVTLATSSSTSTLGAPVILTATVAPAAVTGHVTFYDGVTILGTKPLVSGTASVSTILLQAGTRTLRAIYSGDSTYFRASSNVVTQRVNAAAGGGFAAQTAIHLPSPAASFTVADFNGDGHADFAVSVPNAVLVFLGKGDGSFQAPISSPGAGGYLAAADFNGDGIPDIFCGPGASSTGFVLLGNGDGTFRQGASYLQIPNLPISVTDMNLDANADLAIGGSLLLGMGDGTFTVQNLLAATGSIVSDFNGDGRPDWAVRSGGCQPSVIFAYNCTHTLAVNLGNGDGTLQSPLVVLSNSFLSSFLDSFAGAGLGAWDLNGDGKIDLLAWERSLVVYPGNGDGTFGNARSVNASATSVTPGDFNGDGITDLAIAGSDGSFFILTGNGDGTFQSPVSGYYGSNPVLSVADFNADGKADLLVGDGQNMTVYLGAAANASLTLTATGTPQSTLIATPFPVPLQVTLRNNGSPVSGATVTFVPPADSTVVSLSNTTAVTNASGVASVTATAGQKPGSYSVTARSQGVFTSLALTNTPILLTAVPAAASESTLAGTPFPAALEVKVTGGTPPVGRGGITVHFTAPISGASASLSSATAVTDSNGLASVTATANLTTGSYYVVAGVNDYINHVAFYLTNTSLPPPPPPPSQPNLALNRTATQSSTYPGLPSAAASSAVDGKTDGNFSDGSVTATNLDQNAWWQVDLGGSAAISSITIWNRTDCCGSRLSDYWVFVSDTPFLDTDTPALLQSRFGIFASHQTTTPNAATTITAAIQGRYVRVQLANQGYLSLAEVQVFGTGLQAADLAQGKTATQSSTLPGAPTAIAASAVDGRTDGNFFDNSVTATNLDPNPWWQVDLGASAAVSSIVIWNRTDCCSARLSDYWVFVSDTPFLASDTPATLQNRAGTFASHQTSAPNPSTTILAGAQGRYVRVQLSNGNYLSLAEVQVFGTGGAAVTSLSQNKAATQSSTLPGVTTAVAGSAVDGNTDGNFFDGSVTATNPDANPWWQVDLGASASVSSVVIFNRTDCCGTRLSDYWVFVSDTPFLSTDTPATLQNRPGTFASHQTTGPNHSTTILAGAQGRYVRVQLSGVDYLSLAEVQVFGQ